MKTTYKYIALAALALGFTACSQDDDFTPQQEDIVQIASAHIATEVQTRVNTLADGTSWDNNDQILLVNNSRTNKNSGIYTATVTTGDNPTTTWGLTSGILLYASSGTNDFTAYYPASETFTLPTDQSDEAKIKSADRMIATTTSVTKGEAVALSFERQNAKITITPTLTTEFTGKSISGLLIAGVTPYHPEEATDYTAIITPSETGFSVSVTVDEQSLTATSSTKIEAGKHYTFDLKVGKDAIEIMNVSVTKWTEQPINGVETEEVPPTTFNAAAMTARQLTTAMTKALEYGHTAITVTLAENADADMFSAIAVALAATVDPSLDIWELVNNNQGTIDLTISGANTVPEYTFNIDEYVNENWRASAALQSVTLTDATTIKEGAFFSCAMKSFSAPKAIAIEGSTLSGCRNLTDVYLPSVQTLGIQAFSECYALKTISLPECTNMGSSAFVSCTALETVYAPKATNLGPINFMGCTSLTKVTLGSVESVNQRYDDPSLFDSANDTKNIDLVLSSEQKVMTYDSSTKYWNAGTEAFDFGNTNEFIGYTFKSITKQE